MVVLLLNPLLILPLLFPSGVDYQAQSARAAPGTRTQIRIERHIIIRVPHMSAARGPISASALMPPISWVERGSEQCVPVQSLAAASITRADSVDLVLSDGKRMRAHLGEDCPALGFYSGFYLRPPADGRVCAQRDIIRSRSGGECRIEGLRTLQPAR